MRFEKLTISNFRGFRDEREISMPGDVVLVHGPNGSGKTSLLDAMQWLLLGDVPRLRSAIVKKNEDYLSNRYATGSPFVAAELVNSDGRAVASRRGIGGAMETQVDFSDGGQLVGESAQEWLLQLLVGEDGRKEEDRELLRSYLLQQDDMREFLRADTKERYEFVAELTGLERLQKLDKQLREELRVVRNAARDQRDRVASVQGEVASVKSEWEQSRQLLEREPSLRPGVSAAVGAAQG